MCRKFPSDPKTSIFVDGPELDHRIACSLDNDTGPFQGVSRPLCHFLLPLQICLWLALSFSDWTWYTRCLSKPSDLWLAKTFYILDTVTCGETYTRFFSYDQRSCKVSHHWAKRWKIDLGSCFYLKWSTPCPGLLYSSCIFLGLPSLSTPLYSIWLFQDSRSFHYLTHYIRECPISSNGLRTTLFLLSTCGYTKCIYNSHLHPAHPFHLSWSIFYFSKSIDHFSI